MKLSEVGGDAPVAPAEPAKRMKLSEVGKDTPDGGSGIGALWSGLLHGAGNVVHGGARIGARMGEATDTGFGPEFPTGTAKRVDDIAQKREETYQASPAKKAHPIMSGIGEVGGEVLGSAAEMGPLVAASPASMPMRLLWNTLLGTGAALATPKGGEPMDAGATLKRGGLGAAGGLVGGAVAEGASGLAKAILGNSPQMIDRLVTSKYRRAVKPGRAGDQSFARMEGQDRRMLTAVDQIIANRGKLSFTDDVGNQTTGQLPRNLRQFSEGIAQTKQEIFSQFDTLAAKAGDKGVRVKTDGMVKAIRDFANQVRIAKPELAESLEAEAGRYGGLGSFSPKEAQDLIQTLNRDAASYWRNPNPNDANRVSAMVEGTKALRADLDKTIEGASGAGYQALRSQYSALKSVESDVAKAAMRTASNMPGGLGGMFTDIGTVVEMLHGVVDPSRLPRAAGFQVAKFLNKLRNDPNLAVQKLFQTRDAGAAGPIAGATSNLTRQYAPAAGAMIGGQAVGQAPLIRPSDTRRQNEVSPPPGL